MLTRIFKRRTVGEVFAAQLYEAEVSAAEHQASAEHHQALADMYAGRVERLRRVLDDAPRSFRDSAATGVYPHQAPQALSDALRKAAA